MTVFAFSSRHCRVMWIQLSMSSRVSWSLWSLGVLLYPDVEHACLLYAFVLVVDGRADSALCQTEW